MGAKVAFGIYLCTARRKFRDGPFAVNPCGDPNRKPCRIMRVFLERGSGACGRDQFLPAKGLHRATWVVEMDASGAFIPRGHQPGWGWCESEKK